MRVGSQSDTGRTLLDRFEGILDLATGGEGRWVSRVIRTMERGGSERGPLTWCSRPWGENVELSLSYELRCILCARGREKPRESRALEHRYRVHFL